MRRAKKVMCAVLSFAMVATTAVTLSPAKQINAVTINHGTDRTKVVTEEELNTTLPSPGEYTVDEKIYGKAEDGTYTDYFWKDKIQTVKIDIDENNLNYLFQHATDKPTVMTNSVTIGDEKLGYAGLKTKGNYTLSAANESTSDRFSLTVNFGKYIKKKDYGKTQNFHGCSKICFNNFFFDKTMMKEYNALRLMTEMGVPTPAYGLAKLYINGQYYGVYSMIESMDNSILKRYTGSDKVSDYLVKPEKNEDGVATSEKIVSYKSSSDAYKDDTGAFTLDSLKKKGALTDESGDYVASDDFKVNSALWENDDDTLQDVAEMLPTVLTWEEKLTLLSQGKDFDGNSIDVNSQEYLNLLEQVVDVDESIRYFATHSFIMQMDNLFVNQQNYALYVSEEGKSMMLPWDYDLGWGCFGAPCDSEAVANFGLDIMYNDLQGGAELKNLTTEQVYAKYPLFNVIYQNKALMEKYHNYMEDCSKIATLGGTTSDGKTYEPGRFAASIDGLYSDLSKAAEETTASNASYLNNIIQPAGVIGGIPNLKKVIALRSLGVWLKKHDITTKVTGYGCNMETLGNATSGRTSTGGTLIAVNAETGIFAEATYEGSTSGRGGFGGGGVGPSINVSTADSSDSDYTAAKAKITGEFVMYKMTNTKAPTTDYTLYVPVSAKWSGAKIYSYADGVLTELTAVKDGNIYKVTTPSIANIVVAEGKAVVQTGTGTATVSDTNENNSGTTVSGNNNSGTAASSGTTAVTSPKATKIKSLKNTGKKKMTVKWKKVSGATGYILQYSTSKKFKKSKTKKITIKKKTTVKKVIKKLKKGKRYYVRIRTYKKASGTTKYSKWSKKKSVKIKK